MKRRDAFFVRKSSNPLLKNIELWKFVEEEGDGEVDEVEGGEVGEAVVAGGVVVVEEDHKLII